MRTLIAGIPTELEGFIFPPITNSIADAILNDPPVIALAGTVASGKLSLVRSLAAKLKQSVIEVRHDEGTAIIKAAAEASIKDGHWLVIDQIEHWHTKDLDELQNLLGQVLIDQPSGLHKKFRLFLIGDKTPYWAAPQFHFTHKTYDPEVKKLVDVCGIGAEAAEAIVKFADELRGAADQGELSIRMSEADLLEFVSDLMGKRYDNFRQPEPNDPATIIRQSFEDTFEAKLPTEAEKEIARICLRRILLGGSQRQSITGNCP